MSIYSGDRIRSRSTGEEGTVRCLVFDLRHGGIQYFFAEPRYIDGKLTPGISEADAEVIEYAVHDYVPSPARVCAHCGARKKGHCDPDAYTPAGDES